MAKQKYSSKPYKIGNKGFEHQYKTASKSYEQKSGENLNQYYRRLAKQANQRMVRLEQISTPGSKQYNEAFKNVKSYAYEKYQREALALSQGKSKRFSESLNLSLNQNQLNARINVLKNFLQSPTSTKGDIIKLYTERANTINERYDTDFTWESLAKFFESGLYDKLSRNFESDGAFNIIGAISKNPKEIIKNIKNADAIVELVDDEILAEDVQQAVKALGKDIRNFFK